MIIKSKASCKPFFVVRCIAGDLEYSIFPTVIQPWKFPDHLEYSAYVSSLPFTFARDSCRLLDKVGHLQNALVEKKEGHKPNLQRRDYKSCH